MQPTPDAPVRPGDILAGKYSVERILGAGGMGVVVAATHVELGQRVAVKFMLTDGEVKPEQRERFLREARAAGRLRSQHVARVLDVGTLESGGPYIVMEFLEGRDLSAVLKARGPLPIEEAVEYVLQACEAVGEAHAAGIVHRDLKPANLFVSEDVSGTASIKVLDFGISKLSGADLMLTQDSEMLGSPMYMSPEQMTSSKGVDARSDIWALGVVLYQLVAGRAPFHADSMAHLFSRVNMGEPTPLSQFRADTPPGFEAVLKQCFARDREERWPSVAAFAAALAPFAPEHARVYAKRVARVLGGKAATAASAPDLTPGPAPAIVRTAATAGGRRGAELAEARTVPTVIEKPAAALAEAATVLVPNTSPAPRAVTPSAPSEIRQRPIPGGVSARTAPRPAARPGGGARVGAALGAVALGAFALGALGVWLALKSSAAASPTAESAAAASGANVTATGEPAPSPSTSGVGEKRGGAVPAVTQGPSVPARPKPQR